MTVARLLNSTKILQSLFSYCSYTYALQLIREHSVWIAPSYAGSHPSEFLESLQFLPGMLINQETVDQESSQLKKLME
jgi:hypothetical protein